MDNVNSNYLLSYINADSKTQSQITLVCESKLEANVTSNIYSISSTCFDLLYKKYKNTALVFKDNNMIMIGHKNVLLINSPNDKEMARIIAGPNTKLEKIKGFVISKKTKAVAVLNEGRESSFVTIFNYKIGGDVSPIFIYKLDKVIHVEKLTMSEDGKQLKIHKADENIEEIDITDELGQKR